MSAAKRILIVDDDHAVHELLTEVLKAPGRQIESAYDGWSGLERIEAEPFDLVMVDVIMPGLDGLELLERIHRIRPDTKVVVMTGASTPDNIVHSIRRRAFAYFSKPFTIGAISAMVEQALNSSQADDDIEVRSGRSHWLSLRLRCKLETADRIVQFVREMGVELPAAERDNVAMAFREILINAIEHGAGSDPEQRVTITFVRTARAMMYHVQDPGPGFSLERLPHSAIANPIEEPFAHVEVREGLGMRPGGFGILITRRVMDELLYNEAGNEALLIKYLNGTEKSS